MARLRKHSAYSRLERPYTRISKFKKKSFIKTTPRTKIIAFEMGALNKSFEYEVNLLCDRDIQIRDNALESARMSGNRLLETTLGNSGYKMRIRKYPFHILRENPLASGAGADRMSTGMAHNYGKPIGIAAQVHAGKPLFSLKVNKENLEVARHALKRASYKLPCACSIVTQKIADVKAPAAKVVAAN